MGDHHHKPDTTSVVVAAAGKWPTAAGFSGGAGVGCGGKWRWCWQLVLLWRWLCGGASGGDVTVARQRRSSNGGCCG
nr:hypothetical protein [Tanacetum cinerariifolium]